ncbi:unnamed protein product, partial [Urochloa humidicola]
DFTSSANCQGRRLRAALPSAASHGYTHHTTPWTLPASTLRRRWLQAAAQVAPPLAVVLGFNARRTTVAIRPHPPPARACRRRPSQAVARLPAQIRAPADKIAGELPATTIPGVNRTSGGSLRRQRGGVEGRKRARWRL